MTEVKREALVPFTTEQMYALVDDIAAYPQFLPWCRSTTVHERNEHEVRASIELAKGAVNKSFTTCNVTHPYGEIEMHLLEGPFKQLQGFWRFHELKPGACKVTLDLEFEFSNKLVALAIGPVFNQIANTLVDAFVERAREVYT